MARIHPRHAFFAIAVVLVAGGLAASPLCEPLRGLSLDVLTALRWQAFGLRHDPAASPTVVVAIDEETYHTPPFEGTPQVTWTRELGRIRQQPHRRISVPVPDGADAQTRLLAMFGRRA